MAAIDPTTGQPLPPGAIQRVLFVGPKVHVYQIPPLASLKGYTAAGWTEDPRRHIFTARLRILETGYDDEEDDNEQSDHVKIDVLLEDPASGQLFAAAPYTDSSVIEPALDSARFFAVRVQDEQGRRAVLGIGFEERPEAFDFGVALQEARKSQQLSASGSAGGQAQTQDATSQASRPLRDYSLKEGETITVNLGSSKFGRRAATNANASPSSMSGFSLPPPPTPTASSATASFSLPPPPPLNRRTANRRSVGDPSVLGFQAPPQSTNASAAELGFDDGQNGEFA